MRIYVAGAFVEQHFRARPMMQKLRDGGHTITHDWSVPEGDICECGSHRDHHVADYNHSSGRRGTRVSTGREPCLAFNGIGTGSDSQLTSAQRRQYATDDLNGVLTADVLWLLAPNTKTSSGAWVELGAALATKSFSGSKSLLIVVSGAKWNRAIFTELSDAHFASDEDAFAWTMTLQSAR